MLKRLGGTTIAAALALSGFIAVGAAGYGVLTGTTPCQMLGSCAVACDKEKSPSKAPEAELQVVNNETKGGCCDLAKTLQASAAKKDGCCASKVQAVAASACSKPCGAMTSCKKALIAREASMPVIMPAAFYIPASFEDGDLAKAGCCASQARTVAANAEKASGCCASKTQAASAEKSGCCKEKAAAQTINAANTDKASGCCKSGNTQPASAEKSGCCKEKAAAQTINAANTDKASGCCKSGSTQPASAEKSGCCKEKAAAQTINAASTDKASGCCKSKAAAQTVNAADTLSACQKACSGKAMTSCKKALIAREASMPVIMPAAFYIPAQLNDGDLTASGCCRSAVKNASATSTCNEAKACCTKGKEVAAQ